MNLLGKHIKRVSYCSKNARFCEDLLLGCELLILPGYVCPELDGLGLNRGWALCSRGWLRWIGELLMWQVWIKPAGLGSRWPAEGPVGGRVPFSKLI